MRFHQVVEELVGRLIISSSFDHTQFQQPLRVRVASLTNNVHGLLHRGGCLADNGPSWSDPPFGAAGCRGKAMRRPRLRPRRPSPLLCGRSGKPSRETNARRTLIQDGLRIMLLSLGIDVFAAVGAATAATADVAPAALAADAAAADVDVVVFVFPPHSDLPLCLFQLSILSFRNVSHIFALSRRAPHTVPILAHLLVRFQPLPELPRLDLHPPYFLLPPLPPPPNHLLPPLPKPHPIYKQIGGPVQVIALSPGPRGRQPHLHGFLLGHRHPIGVIAIVIIIVLLDILVGRWPWASHRASGQLCQFRRVRRANSAKFPRIRREGRRL